MFDFKKIDSKETYKMVDKKIMNTIIESVIYDYY